MLAKDRIFGLDLLRATAVLLVIFHHCLFYLISPAWVRSFGWVGEVGVTGLLLLSGYLIGQGLIKKSRAGRFSKLEHLNRFYVRRWLRTLPPYYVYLLIMAALGGPFFQQLFLHKEYFLFLQNYAWQQPTFYAQTWTLAVLEFFYFLFPLLLFLASRFVRNHSLSLAVPMAVLFFVPLTLRALHTQVETPIGFENTFRKWVVFSLDTPIIGVAAALMERELPLLWAWLLRRSWIGLGTLSGLLAYYLLGRPYLYSSHWLQVFFYPLSAMALLPLLPLLCGWKSNQSRLGIVMSWVSQMSYSLYVSHLFALSIGLCLLVIFGIPHDRLLVIVPLYLLLMVLVTVPTYFLVEEPFIRLRENNTRSLLPAVYGNALRSVGTFFSNGATAWKRRSAPLEDQPRA